MTKTCPLQMCARARRCRFNCTDMPMPAPPGPPTRAQAAKVIVDLVRYLQTDPQDWPELVAAIKAYDAAVKP